MEILYTAEGTAWGGREGRAASSDGNVDVELVRPGKDGPGTNPEQLFAVGYAGCFHSALKIVARGQGLDVAESAITTRVGLGKRENGAYGLKIDIVGELPGLSKEQAEKLLEDAHQVCPYSNATRGNVEVTLSVHED